MTHPNSLDLEAFACGERTSTVAAHLDDCATCRAFVERLRGALSAGPSRARARDLVVRAGERAARRARWLRIASTVALPLAAAAVLVLSLKPAAKDGSPLAAPPASTLAIGETDPNPEATFKGGVQVAVIRERDGEQLRFTRRVEVRPGDRLRVEVALDREQAILAAVLGDDASWLELMPEGTRRPGTHFSERSARVDASPLRGTILVGAPDATRRARDSNRFEGVTAIRVEWETP